tara:strand:- start:245 stop:1438 length:1194 start_codon:yes stop_codon:yes gene_type:complete
MSTSDNEYSLKNLLLYIYNTFNNSNIHEFIKVIQNIANEYPNLEKSNIYYQYFIKLVIISLVILPIVLVVITLIILINKYLKIKKHWWLNENETTLHLHDTNYDYIKSIIKFNDNIMFSKLSFIYAVLIIYYIVFYIYLKKNHWTNNNLLNKILTSGNYLFIFMFIIILMYLLVNYYKFINTYRNNNNINNIYLKYLNKDYIKIICNNFLDENGNVNKSCKLLKMPNENDLNGYLRTLQLSKLREEDIDLNDDENKTYSNTQANKFLSALITHQYFISIYNNKHEKCNSFKLDTLVNKKLDNVFLCYSKDIKYPFEHNIEDSIINKNMKQIYFNENYRVFTKIIEKYISLNNDISKNIIEIKKYNVDEKYLLLVFLILLIIYISILYFIILPNKQVD